MCHRPWGHCGAAQPIIADACFCIEGLPILCAFRHKESGSFATAGLHNSTLKCLCIDPNPVALLLDLPFWLAGLSEGDLQLLSCTLFIGCCASFCSENLTNDVRDQLQVRVSTLQIRLFQHLAEARLNISLIDGSVLIAAHLTH